MVERIDLTRKSMKMSREELAESCGVAKSTVGMWRKVAPSADKLYIAAKTLGVSMEWLVAGEESAVTGDEMGVIKKIRGLSAGNRNAVMSLLDSLWAQEEQARREKNA